MIEIVEPAALDRAVIARGIAAAVAEQEAAEVIGDEGRRESAVTVLPQTAHVETVCELVPAA